MLVRNPALRRTSHRLLQTTTTTPLPPNQPISSTPHRQQRHLHARIIPPPPPQPTPFCPDPTTFLTLIGRNLSQHAPKITSWSALFNLTSPQLKELGIEPARARKYLLRWRERFRRGDWGIGGDLQFVKDGVGRVRAVDLPLGAQEGGGEEEGERREAPATMTKSAGYRRMVLNMPVVEEGEGAEEVKIKEEEIDQDELARQVLGGRLKRVAGVHIKGANAVYGNHVEALKGSAGAAGVIRVKEGLWEDRRGKKVDGGERRKAEVRSKRRAAERKAAKA